jgi:hypothetical protein
MRVLIRLIFFLAFTLECVYNSNIPSEYVPYLELTENTAVVFKTKQPRRSLRKLLGNKHENASSSKLKIELLFDVSGFDNAINTGGDDENIELTVGIPYDQPIDQSKFHLQMSIDITELESKKSQELQSATSTSFSSYESFNSPKSSNSCQFPRFGVTHRGVMPGSRNWGEVGATSFVKPTIIVTNSTEIDVLPKKNTDSKTGVSVPTSDSHTMIISPASQRAQELFARASRLGLSPKYLAKLNNLFPNMQNVHNIPEKVHVKESHSQDPEVEENNTRVLPVLPVQGPVQVPVTSQVLRFDSQANRKLELHDIAVKDRMLRFFQDLEERKSRAMAARIETARIINNKIIDDNNHELIETQKIQEKLKDEITTVKSALNVAKIEQNNLQNQISEIMMLVDTLQDQNKETENALTKSFREKISLKNIINIKDKELIKKTALLDDMTSTSTYDDYKIESIELLFNAQINNNNNKNDDDDVSKLKIQTSSHNDEIEKESSELKQQLLVLQKSLNNAKEHHKILKLQLNDKTRNIIDLSTKLVQHEKESKIKLDLIKSELNKTFNEKQTLNNEIIKQKNNNLLIKEEIKNQKTNYEEEIDIIHSIKNEKETALVASVASGLEKSLKLKNLQIEYNKIETLSKTQSKMIVDKDSQLSTIMSAFDQYKQEVKKTFAESRKNNDNNHNNNYNHIDNNNYNNNISNVYFSGLSIAAVVFLSHCLSYLLNFYWKKNEKEKRISVDNTNNNNSPIPVAINVSSEESTQNQINLQSQLHNKTESASAASGVKKSESTIPKNENENRNDLDIETYIIEQEEKAIKLMKDNEITEACHLLSSTIEYLTSIGLSSNLDTAALKHLLAKCLLAQGQNNDKNNLNLKKSIKILLDVTNIYSGACNGDVTHCLYTAKAYEDMCDAYSQLGMETESQKMNLRANEIYSNSDQVNVDFKGNDNVDDEEDPVVIVSDCLDIDSLERFLLASSSDDINGNSRIVDIIPVSTPSFFNNRDHDHDHDHDDIENYENTLPIVNKANSFTTEKKVKNNNTSAPSIPGVHDTPGMTTPQKNIIRSPLSDASQSPFVMTPIHSFGRHMRK